MRRLRASIVALAASAVVVTGAGPAAAEPILAEADAVELANALAEATGEQDVCYGWFVTVRDYADGVTTGSVGSNAGPDVRAPGLAGCERVVELSVEITYTPWSSESEDYASMSVYSSFMEIPNNRMEELGVKEGDFTKDDADVAIIDATSLLPLIVAEAGHAPPVPAEGNTAALPAGDAPTDAPGVGSDYLRTWGWHLLGGLVLLAMGIGTVAYARVELQAERRRQERRSPRRTRTPSPPPPDEGPTIDAH